MSRWIQGPVDIAHNTTILLAFTILYFLGNNFIVDAEEATLSHPEHSWLQNLNLNLRMFQHSQNLKSMKQKWWFYLVHKNHGIQKAE
jgi:hypothetical protein